MLTRNLTDNIRLALCMMPEASRGNRWVAVPCLLCSCARHVCYLLWYMTSQAKRASALLTTIAKVQVACLNEHSQGSCQRVFKPWHERTDFSGEPLMSCADDDAELLLHIPCAFCFNSLAFIMVHSFLIARQAAGTGAKAEAWITALRIRMFLCLRAVHCRFDGEVKIKALSVIGGPERSSPALVKVCVASFRTSDAWVVACVLHALPFRPVSAFCPLS